MSCSAEERTGFVGTVGGLLCEFGTVGASEFWEFGYSFVK